MELPFLMTEKTGNGSSWEVNTENIDSEEMLVDYLTKIGVKTKVDEKGVWVYAQTKSEARNAIILADNMAIEDYKKDKFEC